MNKFEKLVKTSEQEWASLIHSEIPVIYLGTASCGRAAGALEAKEAILATLKKHKISARFLEVGCIGTCYLEPLMDISVFGKPRISYGNVDAKWAEKLPPWKPSDLATPTCVRY